MCAGATTYWVRAYLPWPGGSVQSRGRVSPCAWTSAEGGCGVRLFCLFTGLLLAWLTNLLYWGDGRGHRSRRGRALLRAHGPGPLTTTT